MNRICEKCGKEVAEEEVKQRIITHGTELYLLDYCKACYERYNTPSEKPEKKCEHKNYICEGDCFHKCSDCGYVLKGVPPTVTPQEQPNKGGECECSAYKKVNLRILNSEDDCGMCGKPFPPEDTKSGWAKEKNFEAILSVYFGIFADVLPKSFEREALGDNKLFVAFSFTLSQLLKNFVPKEELAQAIQRTKKNLIEDLLKKLPNEVGYMQAMQSKRANDEARGYDECLQEIKTIIKELQ